MDFQEDRRGTPRYSFSATARLKASSDQELFTVQVVGLGIRGCRIQAPQPLLVNQEVELTIQANGTEIVTRGLVCYWHPKGFAGVHFVSMSEEAKRCLEALVDFIAQKFTPR